MKSSKKRSRAVVTVVACILAVCLVAALVLFSLVNSKVRALQKGAAFEFSYNITAQDSASTPALYNILKQVGAASGDAAGLYSPGQLQLYLYPSGGLTRAETGGTDFFTDLYIDANDTYFDAGQLYRTLRDSIADSAPLVGAFLPEWSLPNYITQAQLAKILGVPNTQVAMQEMSGYTLTLSRQCVVHPDYAKKGYTYYQFPSEGEDAAVLVVGLPLEESHWNGLLEYPQYSRPAEWHGRAVPEILLSGDHGKVAAWRKKQSYKRTMERRPDLFAKFDKSQLTSKADKKILAEAEAEFVAEHPDCAAERAES